MTATPNNRNSSGAEPMARLVVLLGDDQGNAPSATDEVDWMIPIDLEKTAGGESLDRARFRVAYEVLGQQFVDWQIGDRWNRQVEVWIADESGDLGQRLFWGELTNEDVELAARNADADMVVTATAAPYHFGEPLQTIPVWNQGMIEDWPADLIFNPEIEGTIYSNKCDQKVPGEDHYAFIDPNSVRTAAAQTLQGCTSEEWTLKEAIQTLCAVCNPDETFVENPDVDAAGLFDDPNDPPPPLKNVRLPRGLYLPELLDRLLVPHGYHWYLDHHDKKIVLFRLGKATRTKQLHLQRPGESFELGESNAPQTDLRVDILSLANKIVGQGQWQEREVTIELFRGWPEADDALSAADLDQSAKDSLYEQHQDAWRLWVANEDGSYTGLRTYTAPIDGPTDLSSVFDVWIARRRPLLDCLTLDDHGRRRKPFVDYAVAEDEYGNPDWQPAGNNWTIRLLKDRIGIYFDGNTPPPELIAAGDQARVRITGTVQGDSRLGALVLADASPNRRDLTLFLDLSDRFFDRARVTSGDFASALAQSADADERYDSAALEQYLLTLKQRHESAVQQVEAAVAGMSLSYAIGDLIDRIDGRNIDLNRNVPGIEPAKYLQITGLRYDPRDQVTRLELAPVEVIDS